MSWAWRASAPAGICCHVLQTVLQTVSSTSRTRTYGPIQAADDRSGPAGDLLERSCRWRSRADPRLAGTPGRGGAGGDGRGATEIGRAHVWTPVTGPARLP